MAIVTEHFFEIREQLRQHHPDEKTPQMIQVMDAYSRRDPNPAT